MLWIGSLTDKHPSSYTNFASREDIEDPAGESRGWRSQLRAAGAYDVDVRKERATEAATSPPPWFRHCSTATATAEDSIWTDEINGREIGSADDVPDLNELISLILYLLIKIRFVDFDWSCAGSSQRPVRLRINFV